MAFPVKMILASGSPRRRELLESLGWVFEVRVPDVPEDPLPGESPCALCGRLARIKGASVAANASPDTLVLAADTVVDLDGMLMGKPENPDDSFRMISLLNGRTHHVHSGVAVFWNERVADAVVTSEVTFRRLGETDLRAYVDSGEGLDKAGAYAIQGWGALLVESIRGCYFNIVGLPLSRVSSLLEELGIPVVSQWRVGS
jgi:septum formation protein